MKISVSKDYWRAVQVSLVFQVGFGALATVAGDNDMFLRFWSFANIPAGKHSKIALVKWATI